MKIHFAHIARTKYHLPTHTKGSRVSVTCNGKRKVYPYNYDARDVHTWAFAKFVADTGIQVTECFDSQIHTRSGRIFTFRVGAR